LPEQCQAIDVFVRLRSEVVTTTPNEQLLAFLAQVMPGVRLHPGGYGEWPYLRFELGGDVPLKPATKRVEQATKRAALLFESAFDENDAGFLSFTRWNGEEDDIVFPMLRAADAGPIERTTGTDFYEQGEDTPFISFTTALRPRTLDLRSIFRAEANRELGLSPVLGGRVYLVNVTRPLVFHMYDDRGAILFAPQAATLMPLYERFGDWLVAYWRSEIEVKLGVADL
jgi:hypothetical protein